MGFIRAWRCIWLYTKSSLFQVMACFLVAFCLCLCQCCPIGQSRKTQEPDLIILQNSNNLATKFSQMIQTRFHRPLRAKKKYFDCSKLSWQSVANLVQLDTLRHCRQDKVLWLNITHLQIPCSITILSQFWLSNFWNTIQFIRIDSQIMILISMIYN